MMMTKTGVVLGLLVVAMSALASPAAGEENVESSVKLGPADARPSMRWILTVGGTELPRPQSAVVAEYEEGDLPLPSWWAWKCHWSAVRASRDRDLIRVTDDDGRDTGYLKKRESVIVARSLLCTADGFKTWVIRVGSYVFMDGQLMKGFQSSANFQLGTTAGDGTRSELSLELKPCPLSAADSAKVPDCPMNVAALRGKKVP